MASTSSLDHFFNSSRHYLVAGASQDSSKFGHKVLKWYQAHTLPVSPLNPSRPEILGLAASPSITEFYNKHNSSPNTKGKSFDSLGVSFVTAPNVSLRILEEIKQINAAAAGKNSMPRIEAVWFQPGSYNNSVLEAARAAGVPYVIAYDDCILVHGATYLEKSKL